ncbi:hypothetical protein PMI33_05247, partial [Pseudomonas sp. GM67]
RALGYLGLFQVTRRKGETNSRRYRSNGYAPIQNLPLAHALRTALRNQARLLAGQPPEIDRHAACASSSLYTFGLPFTRPDNHVLQ